MTVPVQAQTRADEPPVTGPPVAGGVRPPARRRRPSPGWFYVAPALIVFAVFVAYPIVETIRSSFYDFDGISPIRDWVGLANYREMLGGLDPYFFKAVTNTLLWTVVTVPVQLLVGLGMAVLLDSALRGRVVYRTVFFLPAVLSSAVIAFAWGWIFNPDEGVATRVIRELGGSGQAWLADPGTAIWAAFGVSAWRYSGLFMLFYLAAMQMIPRDLYESATIDGASWMQRVRRITVPQLRPMTMLLTLFGVIGAFREFEVIYILTRGGPAHATDLLSIQIFDQAFDLSRPGYAAAIATALLVLTAICAVALLRLINWANRSVE